MLDSKDMSRSILSGSALVASASSYLEGGGGGRNGDSRREVKHKKESAGVQSSFVVWVMILCSITAGAPSDGSKKQ